MFAWRLEKRFERPIGDLQEPRKSALPQQALRVRSIVPSIRHGDAEEASSRQL